MFFRFYLFVGDKLFFFFFSACCSADLEKKMTCRRMKDVGKCGSTSSPSNCRPGAEECQSEVEPLADNLFYRLSVRPPRHNTPLPHHDRPRPNAVIDHRCAKKKIKLCRRLCGRLLSLSPSVSRGSSGKALNLKLWMQNMDFLCGCSEDSSV